MPYNTLRIGGLASGLDIDQIIGDMMKAERVPLDKVRQDRQIWAWKQEDYRSMNTTLAGLRDQVFNMKLQSTYQARKASSSNEAAVTATAGASAADGIYTITVRQLAEGVSKTSIATLADEKNADNSTKTLWQQFQSHWEAQSLTSTDNITVTINGTTLTFDLDVDNVYTAASKINQAKLGVTASYDAGQDRFFLTTTTTGSAATINIGSDTKLFMSDGAGDGTGALKMALQTGTAVNGKNAEFNLNDVVEPNRLTTSSNTFTLNGVTYTLKQGGGATSTITVTRDGDTVYNSIKSFVDKYNETIEKLNAELNEERYQDYPPLTDEQRKEMKDSEIELWEEKARSGMLRNDFMLRDILGNLRTAVSTPVDDLSSEYNSLAVIGITTGSYTEGGKLYINEDKLRKAIAEYPDGVKDLFTQTDGSDTEASSHKGVAIRLYDELARGIKRLSDYAGSTSGFSQVDQSFIGKELKRYDDRIQQIEERLQQKEDRYWKKFTALELVVSQMNTQSAWLTQQFGGGQGK
ncbi:hypothetical protein SY88_04155 [Clostridiales bacterium PH28_bin88]|nr:hypothetical protein SY88_04155 [Clostridiales bacterium PH28_bin88]